MSCICYPGGYTPHHVKSERVAILQRTQTDSVNQGVVPLYQHRKPTTSGLSYLWGRWYNFTHNKTQ